MFRATTADYESFELLKEQWDKRFSKRTCELCVQEEVAKLLFEPIYHATFTRLQAERHGIIQLHAHRIQRVKAGGLDWYIGYCFIVPFRRAGAYVLGQCSTSESLQKAADAVWREIEQTEPL